MSRSAFLEAGIHGRRDVAQMLVSMDALDGTVLLWEYALPALLLAKQEWAVRLMFDWARASTDPRHSEALLDAFACLLRGYVFDRDPDSIRTLVQWTGVPPSSALGTLADGYIDRLSPGMLRAMGASAADDPRIGTRCDS